MNLQNIPGNMNLHFVDKKFSEKRWLHVALEYISKLKKNVGGGFQMGLKWNLMNTFFFSLSFLAHSI